MGFFKQLYKATLGDERYYRSRLERQFARDQTLRSPTLFVHQMGKVGSTSLVNSLESRGLDKKWRIYQTHFLTPEGIAFVESKEQEKYGDLSNFPEKTIRRLQRDRMVSDHWQAGDFKARQVKVITLVRDPVATNLSGFFYNFFNLWPEQLLERCQRRTAGWQAELLDYFLANYPHDVPADWFELEMKALFGIDVFSLRFDHGRGFQVYDSQEPNLLLIRLENMGSESVKAISEFVGIKDLEIARSNTASDKWYSELYAEFLEGLVLPSSYLDRLYASEYAHHFYTTDEIERFRSRWQQNNERLDEQGSIVQ